MSDPSNHKKAKPLNTKYILHNVELENVPAAKYLGVTIADDLSWSKHIDITTKKANQTFGFLKRNIRVHNKDLKSVAYKTLVRPQLEYASTVWYPHTTTDIYKVEAVQRRAARWATREYRYTSSVTVMLKDLNWRLLDQRRIDSRLVLMYKVTYDLVAIPASDYLVWNTRTSQHIHPLAYRQIQTLKDYRLQVHIFSRTIIHWNALPANIPTLPTLAQLSGAVCQAIHVSPRIPASVLSFTYTNTPSRTVQIHLTTFSITLFQLTPSALGIPEYPSDVPLGG